MAVVCPNWCLILNGHGKVIFSRTVGLPPPGFGSATTGLLSVVHSATSEAGFDLKQLASKDSRVAYRKYAGSPDLIIVLATAQLEFEEAELLQRIDRLYDMLVLLLGVQLLKQLRHVEQAKRMMLRLADAIQLFLVEDSFAVSMSLGLPESCLAPSNRLYDHVVTISRACNDRSPPPAAFFAAGRLLACTREWSAMDARDQFTLATYLRSLPPAKAREIPVFLAHSTLRAVDAKEPDQALKEPGKATFRLLTVNLLNDVELVMLCGPAPSLTALIQTARDSSNASAIKELRDASAGFARHIPSSLSFDGGILGLLFVYKSCRAVTCFTPATMLSAPAAAASVPVAAPAPTSAALTQRTRTLLAFYSAVSAQLTDSDSTAAAAASFAGNPLSSATGVSKVAAVGEREKEQKAKEATALQAATGVTTAGALQPSKTTDAYIKLTDGGLYAVKRGLNAIYVLFSESVPFAAYRGLAEITAAQLDKHIAQFTCI